VLQKSVTLKYFVWLRQGIRRVIFVFQFTEKFLYKFTHNVVMFIVFALYITFFLKAKFDYIYIYSLFFVMLRHFNHCSGGVLFSHLYAN